MKLAGMKFLWNAKLIAAGAIALASVSAAIAMPPAEPLAEFFISGDEVFWEPKRNLNFDKIIVKVSTPSGEVFIQEFAKGSIPFFPLLEDGTYSYELSLIPVGVAGAAELQPGRPEGPIDENGRRSVGGGPTPPQGQQGPGQRRRGTVQSGYFTLANGMPADPDLQEAEQ